MPTNEIAIPIVLRWMGVFFVFFCLLLSFFCVFLCFFFTIIQFEAKILKTSIEILLIVIVLLPSIVTIVGTLVGKIPEYFTIFRHMEVTPLRLDNTEIDHQHISMGKPSVNSLCLKCPKSDRPHSVSQCPRFSTQDFQIICTSIFYNDQGRDCNC